MLEVFQFMNQDKIGRFIAECRLEKGFTQIELARQLNVTNQAISKWENGRCMPELEIIEKLCKILGISINELLSGERLNEENYQDKLEENIIKISNLTLKQQSIRIVKVFLGFIIVSIIIAFIISIIIVSNTDIL